MESRRQQQVASLIQRFLGDIFLKKGRDWFGSTFVTISIVRVTPDLKIARIYISVMEENVRQNVMESIEKNKYAIKKELAYAIRNKVRAIPELEFFLDDTLDEVMNLEKLFKELDEKRPDHPINDLADEYND